MKLLLLIFSIFIITTHNLTAKTYYVSPSGLNTNSGLTLSLAWKTLTYAAGSSSPVVAGDTVYVQSGNYGAEKVVFQKSGIAGKPISYIGYKTTPGDAPRLLVNNTNPYASFLSTDMPLYDGGNRAGGGTAFNCTNQKYLVIKNFQIQNYVYGFIAGGSSQTAGNHVLDNINIMSLGDVNAAYSGVGFLFGSMGTSFSNYNTITNCMMVNAPAEGMSINGDNNLVTGCKVYCNENTANASMDYYIILCGSYNTIKSCYIERAAGLSHAGHGISIKSNAEQIVDKGLSLPVINPQYNKVLYCVAKNMGESFCVRHRGVQNNLFYHCKAIGTHTGATGSDSGEGNCMVTRDGASNNTFDGCISENCASGIVFVDSVEDGDTGTNPPGHPGNNNKYINCLIYNNYIGVDYDDYGVQSDAGDNTIANCTFYKTRYIHFAARRCANMKYIGNIYYGCLPTASGGYFKGSTYSADIVPNGTNTYFRNCNFVNIQGGMPANFVSSAVGSIASDPLFVNPAALDLRLKSTSPCIDASITQSFLVNDFDSVARPEGNGVDMGAYEYKTFAPLAAAISSTSVSCNGGNNGNATVTSSGGKSPYTYLWSNGETNAVCSGLIAGSYSVTISDATPSSKLYTVTIVQPLAVALSSTVQKSISCNGGNDGSVAVTASGGKSPYTYAWNNGKTTASLSGLAAGNYLITVYDGNACSKTASISMTEPAVLTVTNTQTSISCNGGNDGSVAVTVGGGKSPYTYVWNNGKTTASLSGLGAGSYLVTVYDGNACSKTASISMTEPAALIISTNVQNVSSGGGNDGAATVTAGGGKAPYTYAWSNGKTTAYISGLIAGSYVITVYDVNGCSKTSNVLITDPSSPLTIGSSSQTNVSCNGGNDGSAVVTISGGKTPYTYLWSNGQTNAAATGLAAGNYSVTVYDATPSSKNLTISISEPLALTVTISSQKNVKCNGGSDGSVTVAVSGGKSPYTYSWNNGKTTASIAGLTAGSYSVTVYDMNACSKVLGVLITQPATLVLNKISQKDVSCNGGNNGNAEVLASGGEGDYTYLWSPSGNTAVAATDLAASDYTVEVADKIGCHVKRTITISQPAPIVVDNLSVTHATTCNSKDGSIQVFLSGGTGHYLHHWNTTPPQTSDLASELPAGKYSDIISDANGCSVVATATVTCASPTGIINRSGGENELNVFPNPSSGPFSIITPVQQAGKPILVVVRDLLGKEYYSKVVVVSNSDEIFTIDPSGTLLPGVYVVVATSDDKLYERKIVVK